jgi:hypothetical protein
MQTMAPTMDAEMQALAAEVQAKLTRVVEHLPGK